MKKIKLILICLRSEMHYTPWNPLSIEALGGYLAGKCKDVEVLLAEFDNSEKCSEYLNQQNFHIVGFSISQFTVSLYKDILLKADLEGKIILCGSQIPSYLPDEILEISMKNCNTDKENIIVVRGEGEKTTENILKNFDSENNIIANKHEIKNICYIQNNEIKKTETLSEGLDGLIYPPKYFREKQETLMLQSSKGCCWGQCVFCSRSSFRFMPHTSWRSFPLERIRQDIRIAIIEKEVKSIEFADDDFIGKPSQEYIDRAYKIGGFIEEYSKIAGHPVTFRIFTRPDVIAGPPNTREPMRKLLCYLKSAGLSRICMGVEAGCDSQLKFYNRGLNTNTIKHAINTLREIGIGLDTGFIMFYPGLSLEEMLQNIAFYKELNLIDSNQWIFRPLLLTLGTPLFDRIYQPSRHKIDIESMSIDYEFNDPVVGEIHNIIDAKAAETKSLFYALKQISKKDFDYSDESAYNYWALEFCKKNGMVYLNLLEQIASSIKFTRGKFKRLEDMIKNTCPEIQDINDMKEKVSFGTGTIEEFVNNIVHIERQKAKKPDKKINIGQWEEIGTELKDNLLRAINISDITVKTLVEEVSMKLSFGLFDEQDKLVLEKNIRLFKLKYGEFR